MKLEVQFGANIVIAGVATGAIGFGMLDCSTTGNLPFIYVRPEPKKHGRQNQIEGDHLDHGKKLVVIEDLISTGMSSLNAVEALKIAGCKNVIGMLCTLHIWF